MHCPNCGGQLIQIEQVPDKPLGRVYRKRVCTSPGCGKLFYTEEKILETDGSFMNFYIDLLAKKNEKG